jgi:hypothetical protein
VSAPRTHRWVSTWGRTSSPSNDFHFKIVSGPATVQRIIGDVTWRSAASVFGGFQDCAWGINVGADFVLPTAPNTPGQDWMIHRVCYVPAASGQQTVVSLEPQHVDLEGQRVLADSSTSLWFTIANFPGGPTFDWAGAFRVLLLE